MLNVFKNLLGNKSDKDLKEVTPYLNKIKAAYEKIEKLSNDELRAKTGEFKKRISDYIRAEELQVKELQTILKNPQKVLAIIKRELLEMKTKYGDARRTEIIEAAKDFTIEDLIALLRELEGESAGEFQVVRTAEELKACLSSGTVAAIMHIEGAEMIEPDLSNLSEYYEAGLRSVGITWSRSNAFGHGVPFEYPSSPDTGPGLTEAGRNLVKSCNQSGIMIDLSHLNEKGFWEVASLSEAPLVVTHSAAHALCPASRNLTDKQLAAIGASEGLVGINFHVGFIRADGKNDPETPISDVIRHVDYVVEKIGVEHVAFGSDFDGATMPNSIGDVTGFPRLMGALEGSGYSNQELKQIAHQNWLRVLRETWGS